MASKFSMMHENIEQDHYAALAAEDKMANAMNDLRVKAANQDRDNRDQQRYADQQHWEQQERPDAPEAKGRFAGDDAGYMFADHPDAPAHVDIHELHHGKTIELKNNPNGETDSDDDEFDDLLDDPEILKIRNKRLAQMQTDHSYKQQLLAKGHGTYNEIVEDEFLREVCNAGALTKADQMKYQNSEDTEERCGWVVCHFFHKDFEKCKVIDKHLRRISHEHIEAKFIRIDAEKTPFFVEKLKIRVLPCVIVFLGGIAQDERIMGFEGLADDMPEDSKDDFPMSKVQERLAEIGCIKYSAPSAEEEEEMQSRGNSIFGGATYDAEFDDE